MKKILLAFSLCGLFISVLAQQAETVHGEIMIQFRKDFDVKEFEHVVSRELGILPQLKVLSCVSDHMDIWLCHFNENQVEKYAFIKDIKQLPMVRNAQANHIIAERIIPDDPFFNQQWHHQQAQDHDIDSELAWEITTGGQTVTGDEIVVCVVEINGTDWDVIDIAANHWYNELEIPNNGLDDDGNGYVDDYDGWNVSSQTDNLNAGDHGTRVCSMIGSKGNNNTGVTGVNWDVKLMNVEIGSITESNVIAGYNYPLKMRKLYNETNGEAGAFVVATNSSWGTNNGQPADAPLWCAMYDSLGAYGVLSCGATSNSGVNVDVVGDLPTACPSEFLISVGRTNSEDVRASGGFGLTTIDLMAPGDAVYLANNTSYGTTTGTSFSSPCVAGAIALLYSAPCNSISQITTSDPVLAAQMVRDYILDGVDQTTQLINETVSGGRLNVNNSLVMLMEECDNGSCVPPFSFEVQHENGTLDYTITWDVLQGQSAFEVQYRQVGSLDWMVIEGGVDVPQCSLNGLLSCTEYELRVMSYCGKSMSNWSASFLWTTDGCCDHPDTITQTSITDDSVTLTWVDVLAANSYDVIFMPEDGDTLTFSDIEESTSEFSGLLSCMNYTVNIFSNCENASTESVDFQIHTTGCDDCSDLSYCSVSAGAEYEYIAHVVLGNINRVSTSDNGYVLVEDMTTILSLNTTYDIFCTPGYTGNQFNENFRVWIDYNSDGVFSEPNELVFDAPDPTTSEIVGSFTVPGDVQDGVVRMRVAMRYTTNNNPAEPLACGTWTYGEIEDYCVTLSTTINTEEQNDQTQFAVYPNPSSEGFRLQYPMIWDYDQVELRMLGMDGKLIRIIKCKSGDFIPTSSLASGIYHLSVEVGDKIYHQRIIVN
jgi:serine protease